MKNKEIKTKEVRCVGCGEVILRGESVYHQEDRHTNCG